MTKRKLTNKQVRNQDKIQEDRIQRALKSEKRLEKKLQSGELGEEQPGLLVAHHGVNLIIEDDLGVLHSCKSRKNIEALATGDKVVWQAFNDGTGVIVAMIPRSHILARPTSGRKTRPMAANVNLMVIVVAPEPAPSATTLDRYLVICELLNLKPLIVTNKIDLLTSENQSNFIAQMKVYENLGYDWLHISTKAKEGLQQLVDSLKNKTSIFVGQSGVGKSSLISSIVPHADIQVGKLSNTLLGKHTTTCARLYHLDEGGDLIDSPGIRRFGLWHLSSESLIQGFKEFAPFIGLCRFRNCKHEQEPECALIQAVEDGNIAQQRLINYHELMASHARMQPKQFK